MRTVDIIADVVLEEVGAILVRHGQRQFWVPRSQVYGRHILGGSREELVLSEWFAEAEGLI